MPYRVQVPAEIVEKWQEIIDLVAEIIHVPSALIMRVEPPNIEVFVSSESKGNPYHLHELASLNTGLYCETVMSTRKPLLVPDALQDAEWKSNPDIKLGMISYLGFPVSWPDGEIFGTICVLDSKRNEYSELYRKLIRQSRDILETDLRSLSASHRELEQREAKIRRLVDSNIIGIIFWTLDGEVVEANDAFLRMVGYDRADLMSGGVRWTNLTPAEWREADARAIDELKTTGTLQPFEKEYYRKDGRRVPVLLGAAAFDDSRQQGVAFVIDLTERKRAEAEAREGERRYREAQMELVHANRLATMGQLAASIAHEVNQPISAVVTNAETGLRWLRAQPVELDEAKEAFDRIVRDGYRAGEVIRRIRGLIQKTPARKESLEINEAIREVIALARGEATKSRVAVQAQLAEGLPFVQGDRVQLQQVILNLIVNAVEAMACPGEGPRELLISSEKAEPDGVLVEVRDSGPGLPPADREHVFDAFYTTKPGGMGMGLSIARSIVEAHGGRLWAAANLPRGAAFQFTIPINGGGEPASPEEHSLR
jgi:PAS domain S-box-containing protein